MTHSLAIVAVTALVTALLRALPFLLFRGRDLPRWVTWLGRVLPPAIMAVLVVYCLRGLDLGGPAHGLPELIAVAATAWLHLWRRNTLLSIAGGTAVYMALIRVLAG